MTAPPPPIPAIVARAIINIRTSVPNSSVTYRGNIPLCVHSPIELTILHTSYGYFSQSLSLVHVDSSFNLIYDA